MQLKSKIYEFLKPGLKEFLGSVIIGIGIIGLILLLSYFGVFADAEQIESTKTIVNINDGINTDETIEGFKYTVKLSDGVGISSKLT